MKHVTLPVGTTATTMRGKRLHRVEVIDGDSEPPIYHVRSLDTGKAFLRHRDYLNNVQFARASSPSPLRWRQFGTEVLIELRTARLALARAAGCAQADDMGPWAADARMLATQVEKLIADIDDNARRVLQEACR